MPNKRKRRTRPGYKASILAYKTEGRAMKNKKTKLARHVKNHPNDLQSQTTNPKPVDYKRKKPYTYWERVALAAKTSNKVWR